ncbi:MAG: hypothetical protein HC831_29130 [Chloroflexia bacterium]|nr:hypothetical protein [Chloroflexia bacterium]
MLFTKKTIYVLIISLSTLTSCITTIKNINKKPDRFQGKKVYVRGKVVSSLDLLDINCFTLKGKKGNLLIVTDNLLPLKDDKIWVTGVVERNYKYKKRTLLVIIEKKKKLRKAYKQKNVKIKSSNQ